MSAEDKKHGTRGSYVTGCRCVLCLEANRNYLADYRAGKKGKMNDGNNAPPGGEEKKTPTSAEIAAGTKGAEAAKAEAKKKKEAPPPEPKPAAPAGPKRKNALAEFWGL